MHKPAPAIYMGVSSRLRIAKKKTTCRKFTRARSFRNVYKSLEYVRREREKYLLWQLCDLVYHHKLYIIRGRVPKPGVDEMKFSYICRLMKQREKVVNTTVRCKVFVFFFSCRALQFITFLQIP